MLLPAGSSAGTGTSAPAHGLSSWQCQGSRVPPSQLASSKVGIPGGPGGDRTHIHHGLESHVASLLTQAGASHSHSKQEDTVSHSSVGGVTKSFVVIR